MSKRMYRDRGKQGFMVKQRGDRRAFGYRIPREVADRLPPGTTVSMVTLTGAEIFALARQVEPEVTRWLAEKPAKNPLEALLLMAQAIYALLQPPELPVPQKEIVELAQTLALPAPSRRVVYIWIGTIASLLHTANHIYDLLLVSTPPSLLSGCPKRWRC